MVAEWTEQSFEEKSRRQVLSNERNVPVDRGWCVATTTSNALSSWHLVCVRVSRRKADILNTNLAGSFRLLFVGQSYLF